MHHTQLMSVLQRFRRLDAPARDRSMHFQTATGTVGGNGRLLHQRGISGRGLLFVSTSRGGGRRTIPAGRLLPPDADQFS
jgi:hypothetical protein